jgi:hypothetical protein
MVSVGQDDTPVDSGLRTEQGNETSDISTTNELPPEACRVERVGSWKLIEQEERRWIWFNSHYFSPKKGMYAGVRFEEIESAWVFEIMTEGSVYFEPYRRFHTLASALQFAINWMRGRATHCPEDMT